MLLPLAFRSPQGEMITALFLLSDLRANLISALFDTSHRIQPKGDYPLIQILSISTG